MSDDRMSDDQAPAPPEPFRIVFLLFDGITQLDFAGPAQFLARLPGATVATAATTTAPITTDSGFALVPSHDLASCPAADLLCVPGGFGTRGVIEDADSLEFLRRQGAGARYVTSVCTGALALGAAGLLRGKRATTHWAYTDLLERFGAIYEDARVVRDGNLMTAGGVTSGIDFALTLVAEIAGEELVRALTLGMEYAPAPPFDCGTPATADPGLVATLRTGTYAPGREALERAITRLG